MTGCQARSIRPRHHLQADHQDWMQGSLKPSIRSVLDQMSSAISGRTVDGNLDRHRHHLDSHHHPGSQQNHHGQHHLLSVLPPASSDLRRRHLGLRGSKIRTDKGRSSRASGVSSSTATSAMKHIKDSLTTTASTAVQVLQCTRDSAVQSIPRTTRAGKPNGTNTSRVNSAGT